MTPSSWITRWSHLVANGASVLDVACGQGRHVRWFASRGARVSAVDRDAQAVADLGAMAEVVVADIEHGPWPFAGRRFDAVIVTNYLWRALMPTLADAVNEGGCLLVETFAQGQQSVGRPSNPDFLLQPGELWQWTRDMRTIAYEDGFLSNPDRFVQRIAAVRERASTSPLRIHL